MERIVSTHESLNRDSGLMAGGEEEGGGAGGGGGWRGWQRRAHQDKGRGERRDERVNECES